MALIIDETNKEALKEALGVKDLEKRVKDLEDAAATDSTPAAGGGSGDA